MGDHYTEDDWVAAYVEKLKAQIPRGVQAKLRVEFVWGDRRKSIMIRLHLRDWREWPEAPIRQYIFPHPSMILLNAEDPCPHAVIPDKDIALLCLEV